MKTYRFRSLDAGNLGSLTRAGELLAIAAVFSRRAIPADLLAGSVRLNQLALPYIVKPLSGARALASDCGVESFQ